MSYADTFWEDVHIIAESEFGTMAKCMIDHCPSGDKPQTFLYTEVLTETDQLALFDRIIQQQSLTLYWLPCGHAVGYTGNWVYEI